MNDQIVEIEAPGLQILVHSPAFTRELEEGGRYADKLADGRDLVDHMNDGHLLAVGIRWPTEGYWLHFSSSMDHRIIARASDHAVFRLSVREQQLCVRGGDDLFRWKRRVPDEQVVTAEDGDYLVTAMMTPYAGDGQVRIYFHFARAGLAADIGYSEVPELFCESPLL
ncbi:MAG: hypothetical protein KC731_39480 [Myxococcales bacterium]|nr:hypothetical protein [Myxococcales bacterium]